MKNLILVMTVFLSMVFAQTASALTVEVAPLKLEARAEVMGFEMAADGKKVIVVTGKVAKEIADLGMFAFDETKEMLILTGKEVRDFLKHPYKGSKKLGKRTIIATGDLTDFVYELGKDTIQLGKAIVKTSYKHTKKMTKRVYQELKSFGKGPIQYVTDNGIMLVKKGWKVIGKVANFGCRVIDAIPGINLGC